MRFAISLIVLLLPFFDDSTLEESFKRLLNTYTIEGEMEIVFNIEEAVKKYPLSRELQLNLYRILQEELKNILKYAKASVVEVDIIIYNNKLIMKIVDNGIGFKIDSVKGGIGMSNMKRRAELFSGNFEVDSSPGNGCTILIDIPLQKTAVLELIPV
ncbi:MAG TPA: ATP-binding protein [Hanamia sp.]